MLVRALNIQILVLLIAIWAEIETRMSICKSRYSLFMEFKNIGFTTNIIFLILKINFVMYHLIVESLRRIHIISIFSQILLTLSQCLRCSSLSLIFQRKIIRFLLLRWWKILIIGSCKCPRFQRGRLFKLVLTILFIRSILIYFRFLNIVLC